MQCNNNNLNISIHNFAHRSFNKINKTVLINFINNKLRMNVNILMLFLLSSIQMESCRSEIDITIVDRISAILNPQPICICNPVINARDAVSIINKLYRYFLNICDVFLYNPFSIGRILKLMTYFRINRHYLIKLWTVQHCQILE